MRRSGAAGLLMGLLTACGGPTRPPPGSPAPTEHRLDEDAEARNKEGRQEWLTQMHRAAPDADWRAIEQANAAREMSRRRALLSPGSRSRLAGGRWSEVGSRNQAGRMLCAVLGPDGPAGRRLYAGSAAGGVWRSPPDGSGWEPLSDNLYGGVHELLVVPGVQGGDPDIVVAATTSGPVYRSIDDGASWLVPAGLAGLVSVRSVGQFTDAAYTLLVYGIATVGGQRRSALFVSSDRGQTFQNTWTGSSEWSGSMFVPRLGSGSLGTVYLVDQGNFLRSVDGGMSFQAVSVIDAAATRAVLTGSEAGNPHFYAALQIGGTWKLFRSRNAGSSFVEKQVLTDFWEQLSASPTRKGSLIWGGVECYRSHDQAITFTKVNSWGEYYSNPANRLHADMMGMHYWPDPDEPGEDLCYISTDGGVYVSSNQAIHVQNLCLSGLGVSQYYATHTSARDPALILAGSQDQGYQRGVFQAGGGPGPSTNFDQLLSGDYGHLTSSDGSHDLVYSTYPGFILVQEGETSPQLLYPWTDFPAGSSHLWLPPVVADPIDSTSFFFLADRLWRYTRVSGPTWSARQHSGQDFGTGGSSYLTALAFAPSAASQAYAVTDRGKLYFSSSHGVSWIASNSPGPDSHYFYGSSLVVHPIDPFEAFVGGSGYSNPAVYRTRDGGLTWQPMGAGLPSTLVHDLAYSQDGDHVFAATEAGAYRWIRSTGSWENIMEQGTPLTTYWSVEAVNDGRTVRFGTYGRGIWDFDSSCSGASVSSYGTGLAGTLGVPGLALDGPPALGQTVTLTLDNSAGASSVAGLFVGIQSASLPLWGGTLLVQPIAIVTLGLPAAGLAVPFEVPDELDLCGVSVHVQAAVLDAGAPRGFAFSPGLQVLLGQ